MDPDFSQGAKARCFPFPALRRGMRTMCLVLSAWIAPLAAEVVVVPLAGYEQYSLGDQDLYRPKVGVQVVSKGPDPFQVAANYSLHRLGADGAEPDLFHAIDLFGSTKRGRHQVLGVFQSESDEPITGGARTFEAGAGYSYDVVHGPRATLSLGGVVAAGGLGLELPDGTDVLVAPVPLLQFLWATESVNAMLSILGTPNASLALGGQGRVRWKGRVGIRRLRDARDIDFDVSTEYRLFDASSRWGDLFGISAGMRNASWQAQPAKGPSQDLTCYTPYLGLDLSFVRITGGAALAVRETHGSERKRWGDGAFVSMVAMLPIGGAGK